MDTKILIATHGILADGMYESLKMIVGEPRNIQRLNVYVDDQVNYSELIRAIVAGHDYTKANLLVITDLFGGSVNNEFLKHVADYPFYLVSGLNLGLLLELVTADKEIIGHAQANIIFCNDILRSGESADSEF
jgi:fructoselysine and glucoselysine-specific PTS system IIA component